MASISVWFSHASGIIISTEWGRLRPPRWSSSSTSSNDAESEAPWVTIGNSRSRSPGIRSEVSSASRARIQLRLPITVLISPLWAMNRNGWDSGQLGKVFVEKREWTTAIELSTRSSTRSGKTLSSCSVVSMPL